MPVQFSINKSDSKQQSQQWKTKNTHDVYREMIFKENNSFTKISFPTSLYYK